MAKKSRMQDPADAALSAIEEALNLGASGTERTDGERGSAFFETIRGRGP